MRLSEIMSGAGLAGYPIVALVIFLAVFVGVVIYIWRPAQREVWNRAARLPLDDGDSSMGGGVHREAR